jgi:dTDP-4-dehydrorhamnose reductase
MRPILLVGGSGMLGSTLAPTLRASADVLVHGHQSEADVRADFTDSNQARAVLDNLRPSAIVNLAGHTNVDACERDPNQAYRLNVRIAENLVAWISQQDCLPTFVHISTDHLYDGDGPHIENDVTLSNTYALTKYAGELAALRVPTTVLRTNFFGPSRCAGRSSFTDWLLAGLRGSETLKVFDDLLFSPLSMSTLCRAISVVLRAPTAGVFNLGAANGMSKADFAFAFAEELNLPTASMERTTTDRVDFLKTLRPKDMRMDCSAFEDAFDMRLPLLAQELQLTCEEYRHELPPARA